MLGQVSPLRSTAVVVPFASTDACAIERNPHDRRK